eukprot:3813163-Pleurochrysis_carterae.AAC.1
MALKAADSSNAGAGFARRGIEAEDVTGVGFFALFVAAAAAGAACSNATGLVRARAPIRRPPPLPPGSFSSSPLTSSPSSSSLVSSTSGEGC